MHTHHLLSGVPALGSRNTKQAVDLDQNELATEENWSPHFTGLCQPLGSLAFPLDETETPPPQRVLMREVTFTWLSLKIILASVLSISTGQRPRKLLG